MLLPFGIPIEGKPGFGIIGAIVGAIGGAVAGDYQIAIVAVSAISAGLIGVIGGSFFDRDYQTSIYSTAPQHERAWATVGYVVLFGLGLTLIGIVLTFFVADWRPLLTSSAGMLFVVIALAYGESLAPK